MSGGVRAHHSFGVHYDPSQTIEIRGIVKEFHLRSPHTLLYLEVEQASGTTVWEVAVNSLPQMKRSGFDKNTFKAGDIVTVYGFPSRTPNKPSMFGSRFITGDGTELVALPASARGEGSSVQTTAVGIERLEGNWMSPRPGGHERGVGSPLPLTPAALAARESYDETSSALYACTPVPMPALLYAPFYVTTIKIIDKQVVFYHEVFDLTRTVPLNSKPRPADENGLYGMVIGKFEGNTLSIESSGYPESEMGLAFASSVIGNGADVPSSTAKTLIEHYSVSDDGTKLNIEYTVEDPVYLTAPYSNTLQYSRVVAETKTYSNSCEPAE